MSEHVAVMEMSVDMDCFYGECEHGGGECPPDRPVVTCKACHAAEEPNVDGMTPLPEWPCIHATHYPDTVGIIARVLESHESGEADRG